MKKKSIKEQVAQTAAPTSTPAATGGAPQQDAGGPKLNSAAQKLETKIGKIPGIDELLGAVKDKSNAANILALLAAKLGGEKLKGSVALQNALKIRCY